MVLILTKLVWPGNPSAKIGFGLDLQSSLDTLMGVVSIGLHRKLTVPLTVRRLEKSLTLKGSWV